MIRVGLPGPVTVGARRPDGGVRRGESECNLKNLRTLTLEHGPGDSDSDALPGAQTMPWTRILAVGVLQTGKNLKRFLFLDSPDMMQTGAAVPSSCCHWQWFKLYSSLHHWHMRPGPGGVLSLLQFEVQVPLQVTTQ